MGFLSGVLGGSWAVTRGVISPLIWVISIVTLLITLLVTTHELPSRVGLIMVQACQQSWWYGRDVFEQHTPPKPKPNPGL